MKKLVVFLVAFMLCGFVANAQSTLSSSGGWSLKTRDVATIYCNPEGGHVMISGSNEDLNQGTCGKVFVGGSARGDEHKNTVLIQAGGETCLKAQNGQVTVWNFNNRSDIRLKTNVVGLTNSLSRLMQLNGISYLWKDRNDKTQHFGFSAQNIESVFPNLVSTDNDGYKSVNYIALIPVLTQSIQEQQNQIGSLKLFLYILSGIAILSNKT